MAVNYIARRKFTAPLYENFVKRRKAPGVGFEPTPP
jgi:hypothetical protein